MKELDDPINQRFEDLVDMMDHAHEQIINAVYHFCLCTKLTIPGADAKVIKELLVTFVEQEFEDVHPRLMPCIEKIGNDTVIYGIMIKEDEDL